MSSGGTRVDASAAGTATTMAVFFDLDDTLLDQASASLAGAGALYELVQPSVPFDAFVRQWTASLAHHYDRYLAGELSYEQQRRERVREVVDPTVSDAAADHVFRTYLEAYEAAWSLFPDVRLTRWPVTVSGSSPTVRSHSSAASWKSRGSSHVSSA